jgi:hypothetical protein
MNPNGLSKKKFVNVFHVRMSTRICAKVRCEITHVYLQKMCIRPVSYAVAEKDAFVRMCSAFERHLYEPTLV